LRRRCWEKPHVDPDNIIQVSYGHFALVTALEAEDAFWLVALGVFVAFSKLVYVVCHVNS
jgi:hypothetical protein